MKITDNVYGRTELAYTIVNEDIPKALQLIERCDDIHQADKRKYAYLHFAAQMELREVIDALLQKGAAVDARTVTGGTPLRMAVVRCKSYPLDRSVKAIKILLQHGADPDDIVNGTSIRQLAGETGIPEIIELIASF